jgi:hypothetical protein
MALADATREQASAASARRPPYRPYAGIMGAFASLLGLAGMLARALGELEADQPPR